MVSIVTTNGSYISPANEAVYHQSQLIGTWQGTMNGNQAVTFTVKNIKGSSAQVEMDYAGKKEFGTASVDQNVLTFNNFSIATKNGSLGVLVMQSGTYEKSWQINKTSSPTPTTSTASSVPSSGGAAANISAISGSTAVNILA
ncbi:hypothetical protein [Telmatospirillum sp.]|uniref:hypothetical protein n=1 Tax=Telmatospirillum sp. TaxID=2079197 RepID=UPI00283E2CE0|nr:hypothetical protein [Telmatospirillum sp.]MDR3439040.1 hypothetical protein [Telmatospirillum sp.]